MDFLSSPQSLTTEATSGPYEDTTKLFIATYPKFLIFCTSEKNTAQQNYQFFLLKKNNYTPLPSHKVLFFPLLAEYKSTLLLLHSTLFQWATVSLSHALTVCHHTTVSYYRFKKK